MLSYYQKSRKPLMQMHTIIYPGLDHEYCQNCDRWIPTLYQIEGLKAAIATKEKEQQQKYSKQKQATLIQLQKELSSSLSLIKQHQKTSASP